MKKKCYCIESNCNNKICRQTANYGGGRCESCGQKWRKHNFTCNCVICKSKRGEFLGKNHPRVGTKSSPKSIEALITYNKLCLPKTKEHKIKIGLGNKGKIRTLELRQKISQIKRNSFLNKGENHYNFKDGRTSLYNRIKNVIYYIEWRNSVYKRDNYTCQECENNKGHNLNAHHKIPFAKLLQEFLKEYDQFSPIEDKETLVRLAMKWKPFWDVNNGKTLCEDCHQEKHSKKFHIK